jgi:hypothetical protein
MSKCGICTDIRHSEARDFYPLLAEVGKNVLKGEALLRRAENFTTDTADWLREKSLRIKLIDTGGRGRIVSHIYPVAGVIAPFPTQREDERLLTRRPLDVFGS